MSNYDEFLKDAKKFAKEVEDRTGIRPLEVYNRFALLYLERLKVVGGPKPGKEDYNSCKLVVGTAFLGNKLDLYQYQQLARKNGWIIRHHDPVETSFAKCVLAISLAFRTTTGYMPRPSDIRICMQLGSPSLWKEALPSDMILGYSDDEQVEEAKRAGLFGRIEITCMDDVTKLWSGTFFHNEPNDHKIDISSITFAQELQRYIEEHMKVVLDPQSRRDLIYNIRESIK